MQTYTLLIAVVLFFIGIFFSVKTAVGMYNSQMAPNKENSKNSMISSACYAIAYLMFANITIFVIAAIIGIVSYVSYINADEKQKEKTHTPL